MVFNIYHEKTRNSRLEVRNTSAIVTTSGLNCKIQKFGRSRDAFGEVSCILRVEKVTTDKDSKKPPGNQVCSDNQHQGN